jgi:thiol-disulfide isomerase/thioredoxin
MKKIVLAALALFTGYAVFAQSEITVEPGGTKIIKGFMSRQELAADSSFKWFAENQKGYTPDQNALNNLKANKDSVNFVVFGGTWCGDTKYVLPKFFSLTDAAGFSQDRITMIGVDRGKKTIQHLTEAFNIVNVPTIIVMKNGKEIGRVVEYGKYGLYDKELAEILSHK